jgi:tetratricopeptide (TPR) repeat protein
VAKILFSLGTAATDEGKFAEATQYLERAIDIQQRTHGPEHLNLTAPLSSLAAIAQKRGDYAKAREIQLRVLAIKEKHLGPNAEEVAGELINMSLTARDLGNYEQAHEYLERALVTFQAIDPEHHSVAIWASWRWRRSNMRRPSLTSCAR